MISWACVHAHFFKPTLERAPINYLDLIKYLQDQPIKPNPLKVSHVAPNKPFGLIMGHLGTIQRPKRDPCEASQPKYYNIIIIGLKYYWVN